MASEETTIFARDGAIIMCCIETDEIAEFVAQAVTGWPAALEALEEAQALLQRWRYAEGGAEQERLFEETLVALGESE